MSTFQNFKKSSHHNKSQNSRLSEKNSVKSQSPLLTLSFSINQINFKYAEEPSVLLNSQLTLRNLSEQSVYFKIRSNNPLYYQILPQQQILSPSAAANILFKLKKDRLSTSPLQRYANNLAKMEDKINGNLFEVQWTHITDEEIKYNIIPQLKYSQTLKVTIIEPQPRAPESIVRRTSEIRVQRRPSEIKVQMPQTQRDESWKLRSSRKEVLKDASSKEFAHNSEQSLFEQKQSLLRLPIIIAVALVSFLIGYITA